MKPKDPKDTTDAIGIFAVCCVTLAVAAFLTGPFDGWRLLSAAGFFALWYGLRLLQESADTARTKESE